MNNETNCWIGYPIARLEKLIGTYEETETRGLEHGDCQREIFAHWCEARDRYYADWSQAIEANEAFGWDDWVMGSDDNVMCDNDISPVENKTAEDDVTFEVRFMRNENGRSFERVAMFETFDAAEIFYHALQAPWLSVIDTQLFILVQFGPEEFIKPFEHRLK